MPQTYPKAAAAGAAAAQSSPKFPEVEELVLKYWQQDGTFQASIDAREAGSNGSNEFVFYDGPPFANGLPHYGHLLTGYVKDIVGRYQTQRGKRVERRFGWNFSATSRPHVQHRDRFRSAGPHLGGLSPPRRGEVRRRPGVEHHLPEPVGEQLPAQPGQFRPDPLQGRGVQVEHCPEPVAREARVDPRLAQLGERHVHQHPEPAAPLRSGRLGLLRVDPEV